MSPRDASAVCTTCHNKGDHALWAGSTHDSRSLSCITCHSVHSPVAEKAQLKATDQFALCGTCHRVQVQKTQRTSHMPLREGKMQCTSCHNPHGSTNVKLLKVGNYVNEACFACHAEKRGPFLWDHAAGRESCSIVSRPARVHERPHAGGQAADALSAVPHRHATSVHDLRRHVARVAQQPSGGARLRQLPPADSRLEPSLGDDFPPVGCHASTDHGALFGAPGPARGRPCPGGRRHAACRSSDGNRRHAAHEWRRRRRRADHVGERRRGALPAISRSAQRRSRGRVPHHAPEGRVDLQRDGHARGLPRPEIHRRDHEGGEADRHVLLGSDPALLQRL